MAFIDYRIKEINQKVSKDYAIQSDIGKHLKDNLKIYNVIRSNNKEILSNYEEEEIKNEQYYQEFLSQLYSDTDRKKKPSKNKHSKEIHFHLSNNKIRKKMSSPNPLKMHSPLRERNKSKRSSGIKSIGNMSPSDKNERHFEIKRYYRNSCMIPIVKNKLNQDSSTEHKILNTNLVNANVTKENNNFVIQRIHNIHQDEKKTSSNCVKSISFSKTGSNVNKDSNNSSGTCNKENKKHIVFCCIPFKCL